MKFSRRNFIKTGLIWVPSAALLRARAQVPPQVMQDWQAAAQVATAGDNFFHTQNFEGTGAPTDWTATAGVDWDYSTAGLSLEASQCVQFTAANQTRNIIYSAIGDKATVECYWLMHGTTLPATSITLCRFRNGTTRIAECAVNSNGTVLIRGVAVTTLATTTDAMVADTTYHCWLKYVKGTGANATIRFAFSTNGTKPGSGNNFIQFSEADGTSDIQNMWLGGGNGNGTYTWYFDKVRLSESDIGSNP